MAGLDALRSSLHSMITTPRGDAVALLRVSKDVLRRVNVTLGRPLGSREELAARRAARERLTTLRASGEKSVVAREAVPIQVYFEKDRNARALRRIEEFLDSKGLAYRALDVTGDEATKAFVTREARCKDDDLPIVFVGGSAIGGYNELVAFDVAGKLTPR